MASSVQEKVLERIRTRGAMTVAEFMEAALYDPEHGYYVTATRRSGRQGDFYTSVDVGTLFGEIIAVQVAGMSDVLFESAGGPLHLVEAGAGDGRLMRDILDALARDFPGVYSHVRVTLVERSVAARLAQKPVLGPHHERVRQSTGELPGNVAGVILANELLDAFPVHVVEFGQHEVREVYVTARDGVLFEELGPLSDARIESYLKRFVHAPRVGQRVEVGLAAMDWVGAAASALKRGFLLLFDYGHEAAELYSERFPGGTLSTYRRHQAHSQKWLDAPGTVDLTAHVNLTAVGAAAAAGGLTSLGTLDQTYFLINLGLLERLAAHQSADALRKRMAARALVMPGGLGSTMKVMVFAKGVGHPLLRGMSAGRLT